MVMRSFYDCRFESPKRLDALTAFFVLLESGHFKAEGKRLMKLTPGRLDSAFSVSLAVDEESCDCITIQMMLIRKILV